METEICNQAKLPLEGDLVPWWVAVSGEFRTFASTVPFAAVPASATNSPCSSKEAKVLVHLAAEEKLDVAVARPSQRLDDSVSPSTKRVSSARGSEVRDEIRETVTPNAQRTVTILLPALNEEAAIGHVLDELPLDGLRSRGYLPEVLIVDGDSIDGTAAVARSRGAAVLKQLGRGKGWAVRTGLDATNTDYLIMLDADYTYPATGIPEFLSCLEHDADIVVGSRIQGLIEDGAMRPLNVMGNKLLSLLASTLYGHRVSDVCSGMWGFGPVAIRQLQLDSSGFEIEVEMFAEAVKRRLRVIEVPIRYRPRIGKGKLASVRTGVIIASKLIRKRFVD